MRGNNSDDLLYPEPGIFLDLKLPQIGILNPHTMFKLWGIPSEDPSLAPGARHAGT